MDRKATVHSMFDGTGRVLEIGPSHNPHFPRREGFTVDILDHASGEELREKYRAMNVDTSHIEEVDFISDGRPLHEIIPHRGHYDLIFSSHVIEHITDPLGYFQSCELLLKPGGVVGLVVPDKRYMFDVLQQVTTTGRILEAHERAQHRHSPAAVFDFVANFAKLNDLESWTSTARGEVALLHPTRRGAKALFDNASRPDSKYHDVHGWVFTPSSFQLIMHDLAEMGLTRLRETAMIEAGALEFFLKLQVDAPQSGVTRMELQKALLHEQVVSGIQMLSTDNPLMAQLMDTLVAAEAMTIYR